MPLLSTFYGILIYMYWADTRQHSLPHIHAEYAEHNAVFTITDGELLDGAMPRRQTRLIQAWIELHHDELMAAWLLSVRSEPLFKIEPLR